MDTKLYRYMHTQFSHQILNAPFSTSTVCKLLNKFTIRSWGSIRSNEKNREQGFPLRAALFAPTKLLNTPITRSNLL